MGKNRSTIANYLRLLKLDPIIQTGMRDSFISMGHGRALINVADTEDQLAIYEKILGQKLSVRDTEALVRNFKAPNEQKAPVKKAIPQFANKGRKELATILNSKVDIKVSKSGKGQLIIPFTDKEDFERILNSLKSEK